MITVCPNCAQKLIVTTADLRVGGGQVRCGRCAAVFNALAALQDDLPEASEESRVPMLGSVGS
ncbi:MAG: zinc-ribbon domain-containing protein, partial [Steroidobacteraceae bacterium]|nr:zinc-ribbon domain-containing protein [Steroidobacteraceae bacterium]